MVLLFWLFWRTSVLLQNEWICLYTYWQQVSNSNIWQNDESKERLTLTLGREGIDGWVPMVSGAWASSCSHGTGRNRDHRLWLSLWNWRLVYLWRPAPNDLCLPFWISPKGSTAFKTVRPGGEQASQARACGKISDSSHNNTLVRFLTGVRQNLNCSFHFAVLIYLWVFCLFSFEIFLFKVLIQSLTEYYFSLCLRTPSLVSLMDGSWLVPWETSKGKGTYTQLVKTQCS